jgi:hypothetical protein
MLATIGGGKKEMEESPNEAEERVHQANAGGWVGTIASGRASH